MDDDVEIELERFQTWFDSHLRNPCFYVASRAALRVFDLERVEAHSTGTVLLLSLHRAVLTAGCVARGSSDFDLQERLGQAQHLNAAEFVDRKTGSSSALNSADALLKSGEVHTNKDFQIPAFRTIRIALTAIEDRGPLVVNAFLKTVSRDMEAETLPRETRTVFEEKPLQSGDDFLMYFGLSPLESNPSVAGKYLQSTFWTRWWDGVLSGQQINWDLQRDIALIPDKDWQKGPAHIAGLIAKLEDERPDPEEGIDRQIARLPSAQPSVITATNLAVAAHRAELPATLDAVVGYIVLEIERLQSRNYQSDDDRDECQRQIRVLLTIHETASRLKVVVTSPEVFSAPQTAEVEKLSRLFVRKFQEWPRANVDDLVDSCWRLALVGATAALLPMLGVSATVAGSVGIILFGGKKIVDGIKAAKDTYSAPQ